jgi:hypothetical protein
MYAGSSTMLAALSAANTLSDENTVAITQVLKYLGNDSTRVLQFVVHGSACRVLIFLEKKFIE